MRPHVSVLRGARRPRRFKRELVRLYRTAGRIPWEWDSPWRRYEPLQREFMPELSALREEYRRRAAQVAALDALYVQDWSVHVEKAT